MIYDYLLADLKRPYPSHLDRTFGQTGNFLPFFLGLQTPLPPPPPLPLPYGGNGGSLLTRGCSPKKKFGSAYAIVQQHFFTTFCKEYQLFTQTTNCIIIANVKTLDRFYCKERERYLRTFPLLFRLGNSNSFFLIDIFFSLLFFYNSFCNNKINKLYKQK